MRDKRCFVTLTRSSNSIVFVTRYWFFGRGSNLGVAKLTPALRLFLEKFGKKDNANMTLENFFLKLFDTPNLISEQWVIGYTTFYIACDFAEKSPKEFDNVVTKCTTEDEFITAAGFVAAGL